MRKNYYLFVILLTVFFGISACTKQWFGIQGSGEIRSEERSVSGFNNIALDMAANVEIVYDSLFSVEVSDHENLLPYIATEVRGGDLIIRRDPRNVRLINSEATVRISMPALYSIVVSGSGNMSLLSGFDQFESALISGSGEVTALEPFHTTSLALKISGSGKISVAGFADQLNINISGSGKADCYEMEAQQATCKISGSGDAWVHVVELLTAIISGSGNVIYMGEPVVTAKISGSGKVKSRY